MENVKEVMDNAVETTMNQFEELGTESWIKNAGIIGGTVLVVGLGYKFVLKPVGIKAKNAFDKWIAKKKPVEKIDEAVEDAEEVIVDIIEEITE